MCPRYKLGGCGGEGCFVGLVLVDQDGTIADFERALLDAFQARHPRAPFIDVADRCEVSARKQYGPQWGPEVDAIIKAKGFYLSLPVIAGAPRALDEMLEAGHEVFVCTSPLSGTRWCIPEKLAWVERYLGESWVDRVIITKDKTLVGDPLRRCVLVDDRPNVHGLVNPPPWRQVLFDAPYNRASEAPRLTSWADWRRIVAKYLDRPIGDYRTMNTDLLRPHAATEP
jgi:5'-nucleotidase